MGGVWKNNAREEGGWGICCLVYSTCTSNDKCVCLCGYWGLGLVSQHGCVCACVCVYCRYVCVVVVVVE